MTSSERTLSSSAEPLGAQPWDLVIVGAGMVGATLALALQGQGLRVALLDGGAMAVADFDPLGPFEARVSAFSAASQQIFQRLGVWAGIRARRACGYRRMQVWDGLGSGHIQFDAASAQVENLGHIVENRVVLDALLERLAETDIALIPQARLCALEREAGGWRLRLEDGRWCHTPLVVAADGATSAVARLTGSPTREWDYLHQAIVTTVRCEKAHEYTAWQRFTEDGPLAFLPLGEAGGRTCSIVWSVIPERAAVLSQLSEPDFCQALERAFEARLGKVLGADPWRSIPLRQRHLKRYVGEGLAYIGDAAHSIHPLAGQGVNLGLLDAAELAEVLLKARQRGDLLASERTLSRFERHRMPHNLAMMAAMEGLQHLFQADALPLRWLRNTGLRWVDGLPGAKAFFVRQALGLSTDLPGWVRG